MNCVSLERFIPPYLDGEFDSVERAEFEGHLSECADCRRKVDEERSQLSGMRAALQSATVRPASEALRQNVLRGMQRERRSTWHSVRNFARLAAAAAVVCGATAVYFYSVRESRRRYLDDAALRHSRGLPFEIRDSSRESAEQWFHGKLDHRVSLPQLHNATLTGARLSAVRDRLAAHVTYEAAHADGQRKIGLFVFDDVDGRLPAVTRLEARVDSAHGYNVAQWREGEIVYELVSDLDESDIRALLADRPANAGTTLTAPIRPASLQQ